MRPARFLLPCATPPELRRMALMSMASALAAGCFGIVHDQFTFTISPEYFTRMKFDQFQHADFGFPARVFVAEIGFLATWWVGLIAGWFLARLHVPGRSPADAWRRLAGSTGWMLAGSLSCAAVGAMAGPWMLAASPSWNEALDVMEVREHASFNRVAGIHTGAYLGALIAWIATMSAAWNRARRLRNSRIHGIDDP